MQQRLKSLTATSPATAYAVALASVAAAIVLRWLLDPFLGNSLQFITLYGAVAASVAVGGWGSALAAAAAGYVAADFLFVSPRYDFKLNPEIVAGIAGYSFSCAVIIWMGQSMRRISDDLKKESSARARAQTAAAAREQELRAITDAMPALISYVDREQRYRFVNRQYENWFGHTRGEVIDRTMVEVLGEAAIQRLQPHIERVLAGEEARFEAEVPYREGGTRWVDAHYVPDRNPAGEVAGFFVLVLDITERKRSEAALAEAVRQREVLYRFLERRHETSSLPEIFDAALEAITSGLCCERASILLLDPGVVMRFVAWKGLSRKYRDAVDGHTAWQPDDPDPKVVCVDEVRSADVEESLKAAVTEEGIHALAFIPLVVDGRLIGKFMAYFDEPHPFTEQEIELGIAIARQIALAVRRSRTVQALHESEESYRAIVETQTEMVCRFRADGTIVFVNGAYARARSTTVEDLMGQSFWDFIDPQDRNSVEALLEKLTLQSPEVRIENRFETNDGVRWTLWANRGVTFDEQGRWTLAQSTGIDITDRKRAEEEIQRLNDELERRVEERTRQLSEMNSELEAFSYSISHDLRAPLRAMEGYANALADDYGDRLDTQAQDWIQRIARSAHRLDGLISDVLAYSRVAKEAVALAPIDLERLIEDIRSGHPEFQAPKARIDIEKPLHRVLGHEAYLTQCIANILGNSVKFVDAGTVPEIRIRSEKVNGKVRLWFADNGIGIDPAHHERIFQIFGQVHPSGKYAGTGIGLAIVRKAAQRMNGDVGVESEPGKGSRFWLILGCA